jgi:hypothetical protein
MAGGATWKKANMSNASKPLALQRHKTLLCAAKKGFKMSAKNYAFCRIRSSNDTQATSLPVIN